MSSRVMSIREAYATLGLEPGDGSAAAKSAFRALVKTLHPDVAPPTPQSLSRLAAIVTAMETIKADRTTRLEIEITSNEAAVGLTRTLRVGERPVLLRIPAGIGDGDEIAAVGEPGIQVTVRICAARENGAPAEFGVPVPSADLDSFIHEYSRPSAHARLARWIRKAQSAA